VARPKKSDKEDLDLNKWRQRICNAEAYLRADNRLTAWKEIRDYYSGRLPTAGIKVNMLFAIGRAMVPQIYYKNPTIAAKPSAGVRDLSIARQKAKILAAIDEQLIIQNLLKSQYKLGILDCFRFNIFVLKHGYSSISSELPETAANEDVETAGSHPLVDELLSELGMDQASEAEMEIDPKLRKHSYHDLIVSNSPWSLRVPPEDFLVPWGTRNIHEAPWCAFRIRRPLEDVKADPNYEKKVTKDLQPNWGQGLQAGQQLQLPYGEQPSYPTQFKQYSYLDDGWLVFYEVWDKRSGRVFALALDEGNDFIRNVEHNLPIGLPVSLMQFNDEGEDFWGPSDADQVLPLVKERNETRTIELEHKKIMLTKLLVQKDAIDKEQRARISSGKVGPVIEVEGKPSEVAFQLNPTISREIFQIDETTRDDIRELIGFSRNSLAEFEASRKTATEVNVVQQNLMLRGDERRDIMGTFISESFRTKVNPMIFTFWNKLRYIELMGMQQPVGYVGSQLVGDYTLTIAADSTLPVSRQVAKSEAMELFRIGNGNPNFNQAELYRYLLEQFETAPTDRLLIDPNVAAQQQLQMLLAMGSMSKPMGGAAAGAGKPNTGSQSLAGLASILQGGGNGAQI